jgi:transcription-repair coupling factor (superfamily II helicase)
VAAVPDWETLPYDSFSPHQDLISERLATLWRIRSAQGDASIVLRAGHHRAGTGWRRPRSWRGYTFHFNARARARRSARCKAQLTPGRLPARDARWSRPASTPCAAA